MFMALAPPFIPRIAAKSALLAAKTAKASTVCFTRKGQFWGGIPWMEGKTLMTTKQKTKRERAPEQSASPNTKLLRARYSILKMLQRPFLGAFWFLEQRIARLQDQLASQGVA
jgi:hypothetical protein